VLETHSRSSPRPWKSAWFNFNSHVGSFSLTTRIRAKTSKDHIDASAEGCLFAMLSTLCSPIRHANGFSDLNHLLIILR